MTCPSTPPGSAEDLCQSQLYWACVWEATARKAGNVHPQASFADLTYAHFLQAAANIAPVLSHARTRGVGPSVLAAVAATQQGVAAKNPNLGIILLLAPLAAVPPQWSLAEGIPHVLRDLTIADAVAVYEAIRLAQPGGLGTANEQDVSATPTVTLREAMRLAADRDQIARQYVTDFVLIVGWGLEFLRQRRGAFQQPFAETTHRSCATRAPRWPGWELATVELQLSLLADHPDSLIARKCGPETAAEASRRARAVLAQHWPHEPQGWAALMEFDQWLRADGHRRNPGTTADLVAATLFAALREGHLSPPTT